MRRLSAALRCSFFAEECDVVAGFQLFAQDTGGFGALTEALLSQLRDDYPRAPVVRAPPAGPARLSGVSPGAISGRAVRLTCPAC